MNTRLFRNPRLKLGVTAGAALATAGFFGLMRAQTPTHAGPPATPTTATSPAPAPSSTPAMNVPAPGIVNPTNPANPARPASPLNPAQTAPTSPSQPQAPPAPAPRLRPSARTRAS